MTPAYVLTVDINLGLTLALLPSLLSWDPPGSLDLGLIDELGMVIAVASGCWNPAG